MNSTEMTIAEVKRDLPNVPVKTASGKRHMARVSGRLNQFATVTLSYIEHARPKEHLRGRPWSDAQFSWESVTRAINTGEPLDFDS